jgi:predicted nucleotidyltransferase component of viral defense system
MEKYMPRQYVELFHLLFLTQIGRKLNKRLYALKGGCNMRFFFKSPRYSNDIDLDVQSITSDVLRKKVNRILNSKPFRDILEVRDIKIEHITEHKQTETTQRWKLGLFVPQIEKVLPTKIEFSRRGLDEPLKLEWVAPEIIRAYELSPILANHYPAEVACQQKIRTLTTRSTAQARDLFDLHFLLTSRVKRIRLTKEMRQSLNKAKENILSMDYAEFKSQVISYLESEDQPQYESEEVWDNMRLRVIEALSED